MTKIQPTRSWLEDDAPYYSARSDFYFQVVFVATGMSIISGAIAEDEVVHISRLRRDIHRFYIPHTRILELGRWILV